MSHTSIRPLALLLLLVTGLLVSLAPWGPIETRSFAHLSPAVYWGFNGFLTALGLASMATASRLWQGRRVAVPVAMGLAVIYVLVYLLDLLAVFPTSPDAMPPLLLAIEVVDTVLAVAVVVYGYSLWRASPSSRTGAARAE
ncbi:hypothetical protein [Haloarchaeobius sp. TZWSO28]|uniref:hypothetical protein n=1 Tax=Haloarchaeobius sp. TZWSO28 TaxID=3446119 RepID=UPI003EBFEF99